MGEQAHTPGPWQMVCRSEHTTAAGNTYRQWDIRSEGGPVCDVFYQTKRGEADARLITAAPDLYAAILNSDDAHWTTAMRAAMAKAEGR